MSETPNAKKLPSPQERLELILLGLARREPATALCRQAGVSRELFYRWMGAVRNAGLKVLEAKMPGPKRIAAEKAPKEALRLRERVARLEKELKAVRKDRDHLSLVAATAQRIIRRNAWEAAAEPKVKKNGMRNLKRRSFMPESGPRKESMEPPSGSLPDAGGFPEARIGDGSADGGVPPEKRS